MFGFIKRGGNKSAWVIASINVIIFYLMAKIPPQFKEMLIQFGSDLPEFTKFMLEYHNYTILLGGLALIGAYLVQINHRQAGWILLGISTSSVFITIVLTVVAMYLPIYTMGQVVS